MIVASAYAAMIIVLGLLPAFFYNPAAECGECARNLLLIAGHNPAADRLTRIGLWLGVVFISAFVLVLVVDHLRSSAAARRARRFVAAAGAIYLALVAALFASSLGHGTLWQDDLQRRLWRIKRSHSSPSRWASPGLGPGAPQPRSGSSSWSSSRRRRRLEACACPCTRRDPALGSRIPARVRRAGRPAGPTRALAEDGATLSAAGEG
jgi:hypothetical protein